MRGRVPPGLAARRNDQMTQAVHARRTPHWLIAQGRRTPDGYSAPDPVRMRTNKAWDTPTDPAPPSRNAHL